MRIGVETPVTMDIFKVIFLLIGSSKNINSLWFIIFLKQPAVSMKFAENVSNIIRNKRNKFISIQKKLSPSITLHTQLHREIMILFNIYLKNSKQITADILGLTRVPGKIVIRIDFLPQRKRRRITKKWIKNRHREVDIRRSKPANHRKDIKPNSVVTVDENK